MFNKLLLAIIVITVGFFAYSKSFKGKDAVPLQKKQSNVTSISPREGQPDIPLKSVVAEGLDTPWSLAFLPDKSMLVTERPGRLRLVKPDGTLMEKPVAVIERVAEIGEGGLMGIALHPDFEKNHYLYLQYTYQGVGGNTLNRVARFKYENDKLSEEKIIIDSIPGQSNHNGGRLKFGPDKNLYITTGDAQNPSRAQDKNSLSGKILRVTDAGGQAIGNPFDNPVYSYGHRNPQGLAWDKSGQLYATEHGRSGIQSGLDEFNIIKPGINYGWPEIEGDDTKAGMEKPLLNSGPLTTWAPAGMAYYKDAFYFGGLRGSALYKVTVDGNSAAAKEYFKGEFGRIRDVVLGPDSMLYITTSNMDGRGVPNPGDDKIIRINPEKL